MVGCKKLGQLATWCSNWATLFIKVCCFLNIEQVCKSQLKVYRGQYWLPSLQLFCPTLHEWIYLIHSNIFNPWGEMIYMRMMILRCYQTPSKWHWLLNILSFTLWIYFSYQVLVSSSHVIWRKPYICTSLGGIGIILLVPIMYLYTWYMVLNQVCGW